MRPSLIILLFMVAMVAPGFAQAGMGVLGTNEILIARNAANTNFSKLKTAITKANYAFFGLHSTNDLSQIALTNPIAVYSIPLAKLRNYQSGDDFSTLVERSSRVIFPIVVRTNVRSSIAFRLDLTNSAVSDVKFGQRTLIRNLVTIYQSIPTSNILPGDIPFAVEIPLFDIWLIGYLNGQNQIVLLTTAELPAGQTVFPSGHRVNEEIMRALAGAARRYNGLPN